jgi:hypothetical protein
VATQKPKVGEFYKVFDDEGLELYNIMKIIEVKGDFAYYTIMNQKESYQQRWNYKRFPECLGQKISSLEMELI